MGKKLTCGCSFETPLNALRALHGGPRPPNEPVQKPPQRPRPIAKDSGKSLAFAGAGR